MSTCPWKNFLSCKTWQCWGISRLSITCILQIKVDCTLLRPLLMAHTLSWAQSMVDFIFLLAEVHSLSASTGKIHWRTCLQKDSYRKSSPNHWKGEPDIWKLVFFNLLFFPFNVSWENLISGKLCFFLLLPFVVVILEAVSDDYILNNSLHLVWKYM